MLCAKFITNAKAIFQHWYNKDYFMNDHNTRLRNALLKQHKLIFDYDTKQLRDEFCEYLDCPVCESCEKETAFMKDWFTFSRCLNCGMIYLNPRLNDKATYEFYNSEWNTIYNEQKFDAITIATSMDDKINHRNLELIKKIKANNGALLEVGIGKGYFLKKAQEMGYDVYGVELNKKNCESAIKLLGDPDRVFNSDIHDAKFKEDRFDVIYMRDVFEHVPNPRKLLAEFNRIGKKGCVIFIEVPNIEGWIYKIVKERHVCIFAFEHLNYWSPETLSKLLKSSGFTVRDTLHESLDFKLSHILSYYYKSAFTSLNDCRAKGLFGLALKIAKIAFLLPPLSFVDDLLPVFADKCKRGSVIRTIAIKD